MHVLGLGQLWHGGLGVGLNNLLEVDQKLDKSCLVVATTYRLSIDTLCGFKMLYWAILNKLANFVISIWAWRKSPTLCILPYNFKTVIFMKPPDKPS